MKFFLIQHYCSYVEEDRHFKSYTIHCKLLYFQKNHKKRIYEGKFIYISEKKKKILYILYFSDTVLYLG